MIRLTVPGSYLDGLEAEVLRESPHSAPDRVSERKTVGAGPDGSPRTLPLRAFVVLSAAEALPGWRPRPVVFESQIAGGLSAALADLKGGGGGDG